MSDNIMQQLRLSEEDFVLHFNNSVFKSSVVAVWLGGSYHMMGPVSTTWMGNVA